MVKRAADVYRPPFCRRTGNPYKWACIAQGMLSCLEDKLSAARARTVSLGNSLAVSKLLVVKAALRVELDPLRQPGYCYEPNGKKIDMRTHNPTTLNWAADTLLQDAQ